ncbi:MAG: hypothetical protein KFF46_12145, partial [Desulfobacterales bacterium]|nr:hypothetical protein [Desulfobacterales bacterium]
MSNPEEDSRKELVYVRPAADYSYSDADEISLVDLWLVLVRRKWILLGITLLCLALGAGYAWMQPVVYEYKTGIELARIHGGPESEGLELLSPREGSVVFLQNVIIPTQRESLFGEEGNGPRIQVEEQKTDYTLMLLSTAKPKDVNQVKRLHEAVVEALADQHKPVLKKNIEVITKPFEARTKMLEKQIELLRDQLQRLSSRSHNENSISSLVDAQQMGDIREELSKIQVRMTDARSAVEMIREASNPTRISYLAAESEDPAGPGKTLIAALSLILGLMLGVFAAFFMEFLASARAA